MILNTMLKKRIHILPFLVLLPAFFQPAHATELRILNGRPTIFNNNKLLVPATYVDEILSKPEDWKKETDDFIKSGIRIFHLTPKHYYNGNYGETRFWTDENIYPFPPQADAGLTLDAQAHYILSHAPDARFIIRLNASAPGAWITKNPGEMQTDDDGKKYDPSWASQKYLQGLQGYYGNVVHYAEVQPWSGHVLGYFVLPVGEGLTALSLSGHFFDHSDAMQKAWHAYLQKKYSSDAALQTAWSDPKVLRATAPIPDDTELRAKIQNLLHWPMPPALQRERDYALLQRELFERYIKTLTTSVKEATTHPVIVGVDAMKQPQLGWQIDEAFNGGGLGTDAFSMYLASGSFGVGPLLDLPSLDCLVTPADYTARGMGFGFEAEGLSDSLVLRGKSTFIENDARTWLSTETPEKNAPLGSFMNLAEVRAGLLRNTAMTLSRGLFQYWADIAYRSGFYTDPAIQQQIQLNREVIQRGAFWPHRETRDAVAVIIDDTSPLYENFTTGFQQIALLRQRVNGLALCGIPYRLYLLSDLKKKNFPDYRCYLFPNLFKVDKDVLALLHQKVLRDGNVAIFGPGTGITDGRQISADGAQQLLGFPMKLYQQSSSRYVRLHRNSSPTVMDAQMPPLYGDSLMYGPILIPDRAQLKAANVTVLGDLVSTWTIDAPGLVLKEFGRGAAGNGKTGARGPHDYATVFSTATPLPPELLRSLARYGGCNMWVNDDVVVAASDSVVSVHSADRNAVTIHLPHRYREVYDGVTGHLIARNAQQIHATFHPPDTKIYLLKTMIR
jgi:hypothetical protein